jgi:hypothetical protein
MARRPVGPEDDAPGAEFHLTAYQFDELRRLVPKKHLGIRLRDRGAAWVEAQMLDAEGEVVKSWLLAPVGPNVSPRARMRAIESGIAAAEERRRRIEREDDTTS